MKKAFIFFAGLIEESKESSIVPKDWEYFHYDIDAEEHTIFDWVISFLKEHPGLEYLCMNTAYIPNWPKDIWNSFFEKGIKLGACKYVFEDCSLKKNLDTQPYMAIFDLKDLRMAVEQNYRPTFEDLTEAVATFGFPVQFFNPEKALN